MPYLNENLIIDLLELYRKLENGDAEGFEPSTYWLKVNIIYYAHLRKNDLNPFIYNAFSDINKIKITSIYALFRSHLVT